MSRDNSYADRMKEITDKLEQGIQDLFNSDKYREYLNTMSKFHNYSFRNTVLIVMQNPQASLVAGYGAWQKKFKRQVRKGEKGISILAPSPYKKMIDEKKFDKDGNAVVEQKEVTIPAFKVTTVFDVSQTDGEELPSLGVHQLTGNVEEYNKFFEVLEQISPVPIAFEQIESGANGYYHLEDKRIAIKENMSEMQTVKTAIHEIAHAKLHALPEKEDKSDEIKIDRRTREVQAESVAYTVCQHFGIDTSDYSFGYIAGWSSGRETEELKASLETIRNTAAEFIDAIGDKFLDREQEQDKAAELPEPAKEKATLKSKTVKKPSIKKQLEENKEKAAKPKKSTKKKEELSL